ncbi:MAG: DUF3307 domain-containing protein [Christensenellales bacterium]|nr:DUF3307 domain-containing protein [Clostridium sp.]MDY5756509.1 DUF3307 domain-containing protein [Eubacteriales bacterium]MCI6986906.1 DUF3307 domain-containing protein [Clostridium sp.]MDD5981865.1 DUF3307 domain-containing protein [Clostridium sp.]MDD7502797.1 DUF3307 domain-containing protein [Clostridium sp.]
MIPYTLMLLSHTLGDYYFQPQAMAKLKSRSTWYVLIHAGVYAAVMFLSVLLYPCRAYFNAVIIAAATHAMIDVIKQLILNHYAKLSILTVRQDRLAYLIDQVLHMTIILACAFLTKAWEGGNSAALTALSEELPVVIGIDGYELLSIVCALLAVMKPANVFIQKVLVTEKPNDETRTRLRYGGRIGSLERIVSVVMMYLGQYAAIALVFTAKSVVRFKDFENRDFAEYYLYGTLMSVVTAVAVFALLKLFGA